MIVSRARLSSPHQSKSCPARSRFLQAPSSRLQRVCTHGTCYSTRGGYPLPLPTSACFAPRAVQTGAIVPGCKHPINMDIRCASLQGFRRSPRPSPRSPLLTVPILARIRGPGSPAECQVFLVLVLVGSGSWGTPVFLPSIMLEVYANSHGQPRVGCLSAITEMTDRPSSREKREKLEATFLAVGLTLALALAYATKYQMTHDSRF